MLEHNKIHNKMSTVKYVSFGRTDKSKKFPIDNYLI